MNHIEETSIYKETLAEAQRYHIDSVGLTEYLGAQGSDKTYPKMLNFQTIILVKLFQKLEKLETQIKLLEEKTFTGKEIVLYKRPYSYKSW